MPVGCPRRRHGDVAADLLFEAVAGKGLAAGQTLVEHAGQRVDVGTRVRLCGGDAFGRHVGPGADHARFLRQRGLTGGAGDAEVDQVREVVLGDQDVGRLDVAVHQADLMCRMQRRSDLVDDADGTRRVQPAVSDDRVQVLALDQPHRDEESPVDLTEVVDRHYVGFVDAPPQSVPHGGTAPGRWHRRRAASGAP